MWDFSEENTTTTTCSVITHSYTSAGIYNVTSTVTDETGLTDTTSKIVTVGICGDVDHNGTITATDALIALEIAVGGGWTRAQMLTMMVTLLPSTPW